jgi:hypothetical protein
VTLLDHYYKKNQMAEHVQTWRKKLRLQELMNTARQELESGKEIALVYEILDEQMQERWNLVSSTRKQYLENINKILTNQYVLVI